MAGTLYLGSQKVFPMSTRKEAARIDPLTINPTTSTQTVTASGITTGYSPITVPAVTNAIDPGIAAENIHKGITILGVSGTYEGDIEKILQEVIIGNNPVDVTPVEQAERLLKSIVTRV